MILNILLYFISELLKPLFFIIGMVYGLITNPKGLGNKLYELALSNDRFLGVACSELFNKTLITPKGKQFGDGQYSISAYLGENQIMNTQTPLGQEVDSLLNKLQKNHCVIAEQEEHL